MIKKQQMSKEKLWKTFRKPGELLLESNYKKFWLLGSKKYNEMTAVEVVRGAK